MTERGTVWKDRYEAPKSVIEYATLDRASSRCLGIIKKWSFRDEAFILEAGCGSGRFCIALARENKETKILALDIEDSALKIATKAAQIHGLNNVTCIKGDIHRLPFRDDSCDMAFNEGVIEHFKNPEAIVSEMYRITKPLGKVIIAVPNRFNLIYNLTLRMSKKERTRYGRIMLFTRRGLKRIFLKRGLTDIKFSGFDPAHAVTRLSEYWPKCEWLGRKLDTLFVMPLDVITNNLFSAFFGFEIMACGTKPDALDKKIQHLWVKRGLSKEDYIDFQFLVARKDIRLYKKYADFEGMRVLDVGCGLGGKTICYGKEAGAAYGIDIDFGDIRLAKNAAASKDLPARFLQAEAGATPFKDNSFDIIFLNDIIEHLRRPLDALLECKRMLKEDGTIFLNFPPYYGPNGGHLGYYLSIPWIHLLPERLVAYFLLRQRRKEGWISPQVVLRVFTSLNKMTIRRVKDLIDESGLSARNFQIEFYESKPLKIFKHIPLLHEFISRNMRIVLKKPDPNAPQTSKGRLRAPAANIAYILHKYPVLSETFILNEILGLKERGIGVSVFSFQESRDRIRHRAVRELKEDVIYSADPKRHTKEFIAVCSANLFFLLRSPLKYTSCFLKYFLKIGKKEFLQVFYLCYMIKKKNPRHIHAHFACLGATAAMIISRMLGIPFSFTVHAHDIFVENDFLGEKLASARHVVAISNYNKEYLRASCPSVPGNKIHVIHCGVDTELFKPVAYDKRESITRILSGGRFVEKKGFIYLIRACRLLAEKGVEFECDIFGDGPTKDELVRAVKESGLDWRCYFTGPVDRDRLLDLLGSCEIFVQPSIVAGDGDMEGIPVTLMEAMACGKAVISTNISGIPELINSGTDGILVEQKDELKLAEAMTALIADKELRKRLGEKARAKAAEEFNLSRQVESLIKIFF